MIMDGYQYTNKYDMNPLQSEINILSPKIQILVMLMKSTLEKYINHPQSH